MSEFSQGATSDNTRWAFWFQHFKPSRTFFDYQRVWDLFYTYLPIGYSSASMTHSGAMFLDADPLSLYPDYCAQNAFFQNCDGSEGCIESLFGDVVGIDGNWYYNDSTTTGITRALPLKDVCGTHPFKPNQMTLKKDIVAMWQNLQPVSNSYLYLLVPEVNMFTPGSSAGSGSFGQPFDKAYNQGSTYQRWRRKEMFNSNHNDFTSDDPYYSGYYNTTFTEHHWWYREAEDDATDPDYYHYAWYGLDDRIEKTNSDQWMWKNVPIPSTLWGQNVALARSLLSVWKVEYTTEVRYSDSNGNARYPHTYYYVSKVDYAKGSTYSRFVDLEGNDYGLVQQWRFPFLYFDTPNAQGQSIFSRIMNDVGFVPSTDPNGGWGSDTSSHRKGSHYITYQSAEIDITPIFFYSCEKDKLT